MYPEPGAPSQSTARKKPLKFFTAADLSQNLYDSKADEASVQGLEAPLATLKDYGKSQHLATAGGPFPRIYATYEARQL